MQIIKCQTAEFRRVHLLCSKLLDAIDDNLPLRHTFAFFVYSTSRYNDKCPRLGNLVVRPCYIYNGYSVSAEPLLLLVAFINFRSSTLTPKYAQTPWFHSCHRSLRPAVRSACSDPRIWHHIPAMSAPLDILGAVALDGPGTLLVKDSVQLSATFTVPWLLRAYVNQGHRVRCNTS